MNKKKILIVDDEIDFLEIMGQRIESWGYEAIPASNGKEAMDAFMCKKPDVIILDYLMPDINGIQLMTKIRAIDIKIPIIMFTIKPEPKTIEDARKLNIFAFIPKLSPYGDTQASLKAALGMAFKKRNNKDAKNKK